MVMAGALGQESAWYPRGHSFSPVWRAVRKRAVHFVPVHCHQGSFGGIREPCLSLGLLWLQESLEGYESSTAKPKGSRISQAAQLGVVK